MLPKVYIRSNHILTALNKIIGGEIPVRAYGGRTTSWIICFTPQGSVYQAGTLSGNPIAMAAGLAALKELKKENFYSVLKENRTLNPRYFNTR